MPEAVDWLPTTEHDGDGGEYIDAFTAEQMTSYGLSCYEAGLRAERERVAKEQIQNALGRQFYEAAAIRKGE